MDKRITLMRDGIADIRLKGQVEAKEFLPTEPGHIVTACAPVLREPAFDTGQDTEALYGQNVDVLTTEDNFVLAKLDSGYVGWILTDHLDSHHIKATHRISALGAPLFSQPDLKSHIVDILSLNSRLDVTGQVGDYWQTHSGYVHHRHAVSSSAAFPDDPAAIAAKFLDLPYIWGGNTAEGLDCSGLVQMAYWACGLDCPRDTDKQQAALGSEIDLNAPLRRGDLVFWAGHVGIMEDAETLLHANAHHMMTAREPLNAATRRIEKSTGPVIAIKRG